MENKHVFQVISSETEWYAANNAEEVKKMLEESYADDYREEDFIIQQMSDDKILEIRSDEIDEDGNGIIEKKTCAEWANSGNSGLLASTCY